MKHPRLRLLPALWVLASLPLAAPCGAPPQGEVEKEVQNLTDPDFEKREKALEKLKAWSDQAPGLVLDAVLKSRNAADAESATQSDAVAHHVMKRFMAERRLGDGAAPEDAAEIAACLRMLLRFPLPDVQVAAAFGLGRLGGREDLAFLFAAVKASEQSDEVRATAALAYTQIAARLGDEAAIQGIAGLCSDENPTVRLLGLSHLDQMKGEWWVPVAAGLLRDPDPKVRRMAAMVLEKRRGVPTRGDVDGAIAWWKEHQADPAYQPKAVPK